MGLLWDLIQSHLDEFGVRDAALARRMGTSAQTLNSWKKRGLKRPPEPWLLAAAARETRISYERILDAALVDTGYRARSAFPRPAAMFPSLRQISLMRDAVERTLAGYEGGAAIDTVRVEAMAIEQGVKLMLDGLPLEEATRDGLAAALREYGVDLVDGDKGSATRDLAGVVARGARLMPEPGATERLPADQPQTDSDR